jgi:hypothetical protein
MDGQVGRRGILAFCWNQPHYALLPALIRGRSVSRRHGSMPLNVVHVCNRRMSDEHTLASRDHKLHITYDSPNGTTGRDLAMKCAADAFDGTSAVNKEAGTAANQCNELRRVHMQLRYFFHNTTRNDPTIAIVPEGLRTAFQGPAHGRWAVV